MNNEYGQNNVLLYYFLILTSVGTLPDRDSQMIAWLRKYNPKSRVVGTAKGNIALLNTTVDSLGNILLTDKLKGLQRLSKPASPVCSKGRGHKRLSCGSCHSAWVPQCIGCPNSYEKGTPGYDLLTGKPTTGSWVEFAGKSLAEPTVLGVSEKTESRIVTTMPGMILTIPACQAVPVKTTTGLIFDSVFMTFNSMI